MISRETVLETHFDVASFTGAGVGESQNLLAALHRANGFLLLGGITATRLEMLLQDCLLVLSHVAGGLYGHGTRFADNHFSAVVVGILARVGLVRSVLQTKHLSNCSSHVSVVDLTIYKHLR